MPGLRWFRSFVARHPGRPQRRRARTLLRRRSHRRDRWLPGAQFRPSDPFGAYLDPIADKCLLSGIYLALGATGAVPWWLVAIVLGRDIYILLAVLGVMALTKVRKFPPSRWGKISTFVQIATAVTVMVQNIWQIAAFPRDCRYHGVGLRSLYALERRSLHDPRYSNSARHVDEVPARE